jgi:hypothetical protein
MMNIVQALTDPKVLGFRFGGDSWRPWRAILAAAFGLPLEGEDAETFRRLTGRELSALLIRLLCVIAGRGSGKSSIAAALVIYLATLCRWKLAEGETGVAMLLASDRAQAAVSFRYIEGMLEASPVLSNEVRSVTADTIRLNSGIEIAVGTSDKAAVRGRTLIALVCDEIAQWGPGAAEVLTAADPGLKRHSIKDQSMLIMISTAYNMKGALYERYRTSYGVENPNVLVVKGTSRDLNPNYTQEHIKEQIALDPVGARAEWLSEFRGDITEYLPGDLLDVAVMPDRRAIPRTDGCIYTAHCDPSGGASDSMTLAIAHKERSKVILDRLVIVKPEFDPAETCLKFAEVLSAYGLRECTGDRYAPAWVASTFRQYGIDYRTASLTTSETYTECLPLFTQHLVELLENETLIDELRGLERKPRGGGRPDLVDHVAARHDDAAAAVCAALLAANKLSGASVSPWLVGTTRQGQHIRGTDYNPWDRFDTPASAG